MRTTVSTIALAASMILGFAEGARSELLPLTMLAPGQIIYNDCRTPLEWDRSDRRYEPRDDAFGPCATPLRRVDNGSRYDEQASYWEPMRHQFRVNGAFRGRRPNEFLVITVQNGTFWDPRYGRQMPRHFVQRLPELTWMDDHIFAETPPLPPGSYLLTLAYSVITPQGSRVFVMGTPVMNFDVR